MLVRTRMHDRGREVPDAGWLNEPTVHGIITSLEPADYPEPLPAPTE